MSSTVLADLIRDSESELLADWVGCQLRAVTLRKDLLPEADLRRQSAEFLRLLAATARTGEHPDVLSKEWGPVRDFLGGLTTTRAKQGFTPGETATFVLSLKEPLFARLRAAVKETAAFAAETWAATVLLDKLGLLTTEFHQKTREEVIRRQQQELLELSTPVVQLWDGVLALPLIGTLDSARTQVVMENLLQRIADTGAAMAIIDITGVPTVDTVTAQHLLKAVAAAKLMGAECVISGIRPQIAQTLVHLGVSLGDVLTKAVLAAALALGLKRLGYQVTRSNG